MTLKSQLDIFGQLFKSHLKGAQKATLRWVSATAVDWEAQTMDCEDGDGLEFFDVLLGVGTTAVKPAIGTDCLIAIVEGDEATAFLLFADEAEELLINADKLAFGADLFQFNEGDNGGLVKVKAMTAWMKNVAADMASLKQLLLTKTVAGNGAPLGIVFTPKTSSPQDSDFENDKVKH